MHLKQLKLAGFKSFVEPTIVPFTGQLVGVVGPNGCGKSNIIDAVRWVMGEGSAKNLRGESMVDVIFNGSSERKSLGQASVELVFDNSLSRLVGQYNSYQEISIKRVVTRDGESQFYLNNGRCRRRDISDLFLGTGAGTRGYSIIGQDTISRFIEARPEELRTYLEEAAGVSKYKERRRETLQRISHTRENLERIADIRDELDKQLTRLERQAKAQERYQLLKGQEQTLRADILALKWHALIQEKEQVTADISQQKQKRAQHETNAATMFKDKVHLETLLQKAQDDFQQVQEDFYKLSSDIARIEESILHHTRENERIIKDKQQMERELQEASYQLQTNKEAADAAEAQVIVFEDKLQSLSASLEENQKRVEDTEKQKKEIDKNWEDVQRSLHRFTLESNDLKVKAVSLEEQHQQIMVRLEKMSHEQSKFDLDLLTAALAERKADEARLVKQLETEKAHYQHWVDEGQLLRHELNDTEQELYQAHDKIQSLVKEQAALAATQKALLQEGNGSSMTHWESHQRLLDLIHLPSKWLRAAELVLAEGLQAIVLDSMDDLWPFLSHLKGAKASFILKTQQQRPANNKSHSRLLDYCEGDIPLGFKGFDHVFVVDHLNEAQAFLPMLATHESVVTADGFWLGHGWLKVDDAAKNSTGLLSRKVELLALDKSLQLLQDQAQTLQKKRDKLHQEIMEHDKKSQELQHALARTNDECRRIESEVAQQARVLEETRYKKSSLSEEMDELSAMLETLALQKIRVDDELQAMLKVLSEKNTAEETLRTLKNALEDEMTHALKAAQMVKDAFYEAKLQHQNEIGKIQQRRDTCAREQKTIDTLNQRLEVLLNQCKEKDSPLDELKASLHEKLTIQHQWDESKGALSQQVLAVQEELAVLNNRYQQEEQQRALLLDKIQQEELQEQRLVIRADAFVDALKELGNEPRNVLEKLVPEDSVDTKEQHLSTILDKMAKLGAINLMAISEYQEESARRDQLHHQYQDLMEALTTLETAIAKIDKETEIRLRNAFEEINTSFKALFPRLFGGGRAELQWTCDNLLEAGVLVMAEPPGKRNSSIQMLSGGEKAMTAVALVFAIFQQNPSPFCMLDEVDAPLDDLNVRRFCDLVKEMSPIVQFLFITHNKMTMELADQLVGVTMREPGVSRVVMVDVKEALSMAQ